MLFRQIAQIAAGLLLLSLVFTPASAHAKTCTGKNLLTQLETNNPSAFAMIMGQADRTLNGNALLWKVQKEPDDPVSYLFGTMHLTDERLLDVPDEVVDALNGAHVVALENLDILDSSVTNQRMREIPELWKFEDGESLRDHMSEEQLKILKKAARKFGVGFFKILKYKPWRIMSMIGASECENMRKSAGKMFLDKAIGARAQTIHADLVGLESLREQLAAMDSMPMESQVAYLIGTAHMADKASDGLETMIQLYLQRKIGAIKPMFSYYSGKDRSLENAYSEFKTHLIDKRNLVMRDRSVPLLERGNAFIAVGALHLPGETGLVNLYRQAGYKVRAVW